jgi:hypothetical protein
MRIVAPMLLVAGLLAAPAIAQEQRGPTAEQLLQRPSVTEIVSRWVATCVDHAGNRAAQSDTARQSGLTWPYMLIQRTDDDLGDVCGLVSTVAAGDDTAALQAAVRSALTSRHAVELPQTDGYLDGTVRLAGRRYRIIGNIDQQSGQPLPTAVIVLSTRLGTAP